MVSTLSTRLIARMISKKQEKIELIRFNAGFKHPLTACCGGGRSKGQIICLPVLPLECQNRSEFIFWDPYHPTDHFNSIASQVAYNGTLQATFPMNAMQLALL
jgi:phospholipase/lecithinase/hemolysin